MFFFYRDSVLENLKRIAQLLTDISKFLTQERDVNWFYRSGDHVLVTSCPVPVFYLVIYDWTIMVWDVSSYSVIVGGLKDLQSLIKNKQLGPAI